MTVARSTYRGALHNRDFRLLISALTQSSMGDWAYNVALVVYVYERTHSAGWVAAATLGRMIPRFFVSPYAGVVAERFERVHVMVTADVVRAVVMSGLTVVVATHAPAWAAILCAAGLAVSASVYDPSTAAMLPQLLGEDNLAAGNALMETINNLAIIVGPAVGAIVLALGNPAIVMGLDAGTFVLSALLVSRLHARSAPTDVSRDGGPLRQVTVGIRALLSSSTAMLLTTFTVVTTMLYGADTVLFVFLSKNKLGTGAEGYGYLLVALGVGGLIAAMFINRLAALPRLSVVLSVGMIAYAAPTAALVVVHSPSVAFAIEVVRGIATLVVDVLAMTALQRSLAPDLIARVFGVFWALALGGLSIGSFVMPFLLNALGLDGALLVDALAVPVGVALVYPRLASLDKLSATEAVELAPRVAVMQRFDIFAAASQPMLERLARNATQLVVEAGTPIIREGEAADALYVLVDGRVDVTARGEKRARPKHIRYMTAPSYLGEIGLLQGVPRTATVVATEASRLWRIDGETFLAALTETSLSPTFLSGMTMRLARTHPSRALTVPTPRQPAETSIDAENSTAPVSEKVSQ